MLWLEHRVVAALAGDSDRLHGGAITDFVETSLLAMPQHLRLGVAVESVALGAWIRMRYAGGRDDAAIRRALTSFEHAPIGVIRQYPQLFNSLVIFAREELAAP